VQHSGFSEPSSGDVGAQATECAAERGVPEALRLTAARLRQISELWTQATEVETEPYAALANMDRIRYQSELEAYNYRCLGLFARLSVKLD